jgi:hypothetical protein
MTNEQFTQFFYVVLEERIPKNGKAAIANYWGRFKVEPTLILGDAKIPSVFGSLVNIAAVRGRDCLHIFAFRDFLVQHAPEPILQTIIQHELIHCFCEKDKQPEVYDEFFFRRPIFTSKWGLIRSSIQQVESGVRRTIQYNLGENLVTQINKDWGGDEVEARKWIEAHKCK